MYLSHRPITSGDLDACWRIVQAVHPTPPMPRAGWAEFWRHQLAAESALSVVVEDSDRPPEARLCACAISVFLTEAFAEATRTILRPSIVGHLYAQTEEGDSPILGPAAIGRANAGDGLILFNGPFGYAADLTEREQVAAAEVMFSAFFSYHAGYQIKEFLVEHAFPDGWVASIASGLRLRTANVDAPEELLALCGLTRQEAFKALDSRFFPLFLYTRPRLGFRPSQQRLLNQALRGGTNEEVARSLSVSLSAVKKGWEAIYARVAEADPALLACAEEEAGLEAKRGGEKKDRLLSYLRQHPEELRPYAL